MSESQYCSVLCNWNLTGSRQWADVLQFIVEDEDQLSREDDDTFITLQPPNPTSPCEVVVKCRPEYRMESVVVVSDSRVQEVYDRREDYIQTVHAKLYSEESTNKLYYSVFKFQLPVCNLKLKFLSLEMRDMFHICHFVVHLCRLSPDAADIPTEPRGSINYDVVRSMLGEMKTNLPPDAEMLINYLEKSQKSRQAPNGVSSFLSTFANMGVDSVQDMLSKYTPFKLPIPSSESKSESIQADSTSTNSSREPSPEQRQLDDLELRLNRRLEYHEERITSFVETRLRDFQGTLLQKIENLLTRTMLQRPQNTRSNEQNNSAHSQNVTRRVRSGIYAGYETSKPSLTNFSKSFSGYEQKHGVFQEPIARSAHSLQQNGLFGTVGESGKSDRLFSQRKANITNNINASASNKTPGSVKKSYQEKPLPKTVNKNDSIRVCSDGRQTSRECPTINDKSHKCSDCHFMSNDVFYVADDGAIYSVEVSDLYPSDVDPTADYIYEYESSSNSVSNANINTSNSIKITDSNDIPSSMSNSDEADLNITQISMPYSESAQFYNTPSAKLNINASSCIQDGYSAEKANQSNPLTKNNLDSFINTESVDISDICDVECDLLATAIIENCFSGIIADVNKEHFYDKIKVPLPHHLCNSTESNFNENAERSSLESVNCGGSNVGGGDETVLDEHVNIVSETLDDCSGFPVVYNNLCEIGSCLERMIVSENEGSVESNDEIYEGGVSDIYRETADKTSMIMDTDNIDHKLLVNNDLLNTEKQENETCLDGMSSLAEQSNEVQLDGRSSDGIRSDDTFGDTETSVTPTKRHINCNDLEESETTISSEYNGEKIPDDSNESKDDINTVSSESKSETVLNIQTPISNGTNLIDLRKAGDTIDQHASENSAHISPANLSSSHETKTIHTLHNHDNCPVNTPESSSSINTHLKPGIILRSTEHSSNTVERLNIACISQSPSLNLEQLSPIDLQISAATNDFSPTGSQSSNNEIDDNILFVSPDDGYCD